MQALITSCGRFDLLIRTLQSLYKNQQSTFFLTINEDGITKNGQHSSIEKFLNSINGKYYIHAECDWTFNNTYDWIFESVAIMEKDPMVIKVLARFDSPHPCEHTEFIREGLSYGFLKPWIGLDGIEWCGFSWNPGVTRLDLLKKFIPLATYEQDVAKQIYEAGYKVVELSVPVYTHIGDGRSTHQ